MLDIKLYGKRTSSYGFLKKHLTDFLHFNNLTFDLVEYNNVNDFINDQVNSIPCVVINDSIKVEVSKQENIKKAILLLYHIIVDHVGLHKVRKIIIPFDFSKASLNAIHQSKIFLLSNHYAILLLVATNEYSTDPEVHESSYLHTKKRIKELSEKLEDDYVGDVSYITPIYSKILSKDHWFGISETKALHQEDIILHNCDSELFSFDDTIIKSLLHSELVVLLIYNSTNLDKEKGISSIVRNYTFSHNLEYNTSEPNNKIHFPSKVDTLLDEPSFAILSRSSYESSDDSKIELVKRCLKNEVPLIII